jgi:hypothetical protein
MSKTKPRVETANAAEEWVPFRPVNLEALQVQRHPQTAFYLPLVEKFLASGHPAVEIFPPAHSPNMRYTNLSTNLRNAINAHELPAKVMVRKGKVYLVRAEVDISNGVTISG